MSLVWVTRALGNHPTVPEATCRRIQQAALEMGYHNGSNRDARALAARRYGRKIRSGIIAVLAQQARKVGAVKQERCLFQARLAVPMLSNDLLRLDDQSLVIRLGSRRNPGHDHGKFRSGSGVA